MAWSDSIFTLDDWLKSDQDPDYLASKWVQNYVYNTLLLTDLLNKVAYWKPILMELAKASGWKWLYSKKYRLT